MYGSNPYSRPYSNIGQQNMYEQIDNQINQLQQMREQIKNNSMQPAINQTFQLAPTHQTMKYASSINDVNKESVVDDTPFFSKDMSVVWIKSNKGEIKTYELNEIVAKDSKDMQIEFLQAQIEELRKEMKKNEQLNTNDTRAEVEPDTDEYDEPIGSTIKTSKSSNVSRISTSKKK